MPHVILMVPAASIGSASGAHRTLRGSDDPATPACAPGTVVTVAQLDTRFSALVDPVIAADLVTMLPGSCPIKARGELSVSAFFYRWFIVDRRTGGRKLMPHFMTFAQAGGLYPGAQPDLRTCEVRAVSRSRLERY